MKFDAIVIGCGPAGSTTARILAQSGLKVAAIDKSDFPRYKTCGGGIIGRSLKLLPRECHHVIETKCSKVQLNLDHDLNFLVERNDPVVSMVMRERMDHELLKMAKASGVKVYEGVRVNRIDFEGHWKVGMDSDQLTSPALFISDGVSGPAAKRAGFEDGRHVIPALEVELPVSDCDWKRFEGCARFDFVGIPMGYAWVFPKAKVLSIGVLSMKRGRVGLKDLLGSYCEQLSLTGLDQVKIHGHSIPVGPRSGKLAQEGAFLLGDTAGLADPITAEGISAALWSGQIAAESLLHSNDPSGASEVYQKQMEKSLLKELRWSRRLAHLLYGRSNQSRWIFKKWGQHFSEKLVDVIQGDTSLRSECTSPSNWMKLLIR